MLKLEQGTAPTSQTRLENMNFSETQMDESEEGQNMKVVGNVLRNVSVKFGDFLRSFTYPTNDEQIRSKQGNFQNLGFCCNLLESRL